MKIYSPPRPRDAHFNGIFYGRTGAGKTTLIGSAGRCKSTSPILIVDVNGGMLSLADADPSTVKITHPTSFAEIQEIYEYLRHDNTRFQSVAIDTLTDEQRDISLGTLLGDIDDELEYKDLGSEKVPHQQEWLKSSHHMRKIIRAFRDLSYLRNRDRRVHVFMTAHERIDDASELGVPSISGIVGVESGGYVDVLGRMTRRKYKVDGKTKIGRYLHTDEHEGDNGHVYLAKNRLGRLGAGVMNPTMDKLIALWTGEAE